MNRREILGTAGGLIAAATALPTLAQAPQPPVERIPVPKGGKIRVAFVISTGANVIDLAGSWETFQDTMIGPGGYMPFEAYTTAETTDIVEMTNGLRVEPTYSFDGIPDMPHVVVVPAQSNASPKFMELLRTIQGHVDVTMSICTGAFKLARSGILDGKKATTHHDAYDDFAKEYPKVELVRGVRFVDNGSIITAGGLTSGISAALHVVSRYYGDDASTSVARYMEFVPTARPS